MIRNRLRIFCGPEDDSQVVATAPTHSPSTVTVPAGEIFTSLADAIEKQRSWVKDFEDDEITISADLYDVILAYQHIQRPSA